VQASLALCKQHGRFLYEARADLFPQGYLTLDEIELWGRYYESLRKER